MVTYNQIVKAFQNFATQHKQINTFHCGKLSDFQTLSNLFPAMIVIPQPSQVNNGSMRLNFNVFIVDLLNRDNSNTEEIHSDTLLILNDFFKYLEYGEELFSITTDAKNVESFVELMDDSVAGWVGSFTIEYAIKNHCVIPWPTPMNYDDTVNNYVVDDYAEDYFL